jgi:hypothetical protein
VTILRRENVLILKAFNYKLVQNNHCILFFLFSVGTLHNEVKFVDFDCFSVVKFVNSFLEGIVMILIYNEISGSIILLYTIFLEQLNLN